MDYDSKITHNIIGQCWVAIGKGVGQKMISAEAVGIVSGRYLRLVGAMSHDWDSLEEEVLAFATGLGILAAANAEEQLSSVITAENMEAAFATIMRPCPCDRQMS